MFYPEREGGRSRRARGRFSSPSPPLEVRAEALTFCASPPPPLSPPPAAAPRGGGALCRRALRYFMNGAGAAGGRGPASYNRGRAVSAAANRGAGRGRGGRGGAHGHTRDPLPGPVPGAHAWLAAGARESCGAGRSPGGDPAPVCREGKGREGRGSGASPAGVTHICCRSRRAAAVEVRAALAPSRAPCFTALGRGRTRLRFDKPGAEKFRASSRSGEASCL